jgi:hypothetical protein
MLSLTRDIDIDEIYFVNSVNKLKKKNNDK